MPRRTQYAAVSRSASRTSGLTLLGEAVAGRQHRELAAEVVGLPPQHVAEQDGRLVVEVVAGDDDVVAAAAGGVVEQVALRTGRTPSTAPAWRPWRRSGCRSRGRRGRSTSMERQRRARRRTPGRALAGRRRCSRRCRGRCRARRRGSRAPGGCPRRRGSPCRRRRPRAPGRRAGSCRSRRWPWPPGRGTAAGSGPGRSWRCGGGRR